MTCDIDQLMNQPLDTFCPTCGHVAAMHRVSALNEAVCNVCEAVEDFERRLALLGPHLQKIADAMEAMADCVQHTARTLADASNACYLGDAQK